MTRRVIYDAHGEIAMTAAEADAEAGIAPCECRRTRDGIEPCGYCEARAEAEAEAVAHLEELPEAYGLTLTDTEG